MLKALLVSSDRESISMVSQTIMDFCPHVTFLGVADNIQAGVSMINSTQPDLLILDTKLTDGSGFEMLKHFESYTFKILVLSSHIEYTLMAFKYNAVDFLLKPPDPDELIQAINKVSDLINREEKLHFNILAENIRNLNKKGKIILKTFDHIHIVNQDEIIRIEADRNYSTFHIVDGRKIMVSRSIKDFEDQLNDKGFYRIHKSHLINISMVKYFDKAEGGYVVMNDGVSVPVASRKRELLLGLFEDMA
jgi:two-component system, LytTR family, response regulator